MFFDIFATWAVDIESLWMVTEDYEEQIVNDVVLYLIEEFCIISTMYYLLSFKIHWISLVSCIASLSLT